MSSDLVSNGLSGLFVYIKCGVKKIDYVRMQIDMIPSISLLVLSDHWKLCKAIMNIKHRARQRLDASRNESQ